MNCILSVLALSFTLLSLGASRSLAAEAAVTCAVSSAAEFDENLFTFSEGGAVYGSSQTAERVPSAIPRQDFVALETMKIKNRWDALRLVPLYDTQNRAVVYLLGETHLKKNEASRLGKNVLSRFRVVATEGVLYQSEMAVMSPILSAFVDIYSSMSSVVRLFGLQSTAIVDAQETRYVQSCEESKRRPADSRPILTLLECGEFKTVPKGVCSFKKSDSEACDAQIIGMRNVRMLKNLVQAIDLMPTREPLLALMGRAHLPGISNALVKTGRFKFISECW